MISYSTFYNFTLSRTTVAGLICPCTYTIVREIVTLMNGQTDFLLLHQGADCGEKTTWGVKKKYPLISQLKRGIFTSDAMAGPSQISVRHRVLDGG